MGEKLNIKKVIIAILILLLLVVSIIVFVILRNMDSEKSDENSVSTEIFTDINETISIEISKKYNLEQLYNSEYLIKLSSEDFVDIYISKIDKIDGKSLEIISRADKLSYLEAYNAYSNASDLKELEVNGNKAFTYSFHYLDENLNKAFYIQVVLLEFGEEIYIFDIDFPLEDLVLYTDIITETLANFKHL